METAHGERRDPTLFVFADPPVDDELRFWLATRAMPWAALQEDPPLQIPPHLPLIVSTRRPIHFCPWCGTKLARFYKRRFEQLLDPELSSEFGPQARP